MKNINSRISILALAAFAFILSSCSQQRYANRSYVKKEVVASAEVKKQEVAQLPAIPAPQTQLAEVPQSLAPVAIEVPAAQEVKTQEPKKVEPKAKSAASAGFLAQVKEKATKTVLKRVEKVQKTDSNGEISLNNKWVRLMIIGLIIVLIGLLLPDPLGRIFDIVGSILIIIGLIFFLLELL